MSITIITSTNKRISYKFSNKSGRIVSLDGIEFLICKFSGGWRVLAPHLSSSYFLANKPFVYETRKEGITHMEANKEILKKHIQSIKKECGEVVIKDIKEDDVKKEVKVPIAHMVLLVPHGKCHKFGHVMVWDHTNAFYRQVNVSVWDASVENIKKRMVERGYDLKVITKNTKDCNYKKKVLNFRAYCHTNRIVVVA